MKKLACVEPDPGEKNLLIKRIGVWGFAFFAIKGIGWIFLSAALAWFGMN